MANQEATVVITHHILDGKQHEYEEWLNEIGSFCRSSTGNIDWQIIRPITNLTFTNNVIIRFDTIENLKNWMESDERKNLMKKAIPMFAKDDNYVIKSGLDFLFQKDKEDLKVPVRWKQYLVTWSAIYPLTIIVPFLLLPLIRITGFSENNYVDSFFISATLVFIMVYILMPSYTKLIKKWLFK